MDLNFQHILTEDRQRSNKIVLIWMTIFSGLVFFVWALGMFKVFSVSSWLFYYSVPVAAMILLVPKIANIVFELSTIDKDGKSLAIISISCSIISVFLLSSTLSHHFVLGWIFPLLIACQYSSKKATVATYILGVFGLIGSFYVSMHLGLWDNNLLSSISLNPVRSLNISIVSSALIYLIPKILLYIFTFPLVYSITKRSELLLKKQRLLIMAHQAKKSLDELSEFPDTFETDCKIKARYLAKNGIDVDTALLSMENSIEKYNDFVLTFIGESNRKQEELFNLLDTDTLLTYGAKVHALRIKANALGLNHLTDTAFFHEMEAYAGNYEIVLANWEKLIFEWKEAVELFNDYVQSLGLRNHAYDKTGNQISFQEWGEQLQMAFDALDAYDTIRARDILNHLLQYQIDTDISQKLTTIVANIDDILKA